MAIGLLVLWLKISIDVAKNKKKRRKFDVPQNEPCKWKRNANVSNCFVTYNSFYFILFSFGAALIQLWIDFLLF